MDHLRKAFGLPQGFGEAVDQQLRDPDFLRARRRSADSKKDRRGRGGGWALGGEKECDHQANFRHVLWILNDSDGSSDGVRMF